MEHPSRARMAALCIGGGLLLLCGYYVAATFHWREAFARLAGANIAWFAVGGTAAILGFWLVRALRWQLLLRAMHADVAFADVYLCSSVALSLSVFTPLQSGEALKVELLKKYGSVGRLPGYSAFMLERIVDLYVVVSMGLVALASLSGSLGQGMILAALLAALPMAGYLLLRKQRLPGRLGDVLGPIQDGLRSPGMLLAVLVATVLSWGLVALGWQACLLSLSIGLGPAELLGLLSAITLASILSFIPAGLGIAEAGATELLIGYGIGEAQAQAAALMLRAFSLLIVALGAVHLALLRRHASRRR